MKASNQTNKAIHEAAHQPVADRDLWCIIAWTKHRQQDSLGLGAGTGKDQYDRSKRGSSQRIRGEERQRRDMCWRGDSDRSYREEHYEESGGGGGGGGGGAVPGSAVGIMEEPLSESKTAEVAEGTTVSKSRGVGGTGGCSAQQSEGEMFRNSWTLSKVLPLPRSVSNGVTVTGEKMPFVSECGASFAKFGDLSKHVKTHFGARPFPCLECGSTFTASSHLKSHMTIHSGEKPFSCKDCDATFARPCQQKSHTMRRHTSLMTRPYPCSQCSSAFLTRWELKEQQQIHSGTKSFTCRACSVTFSCPSYLKRHALRTHTPVNTRPSGPSLLHAGRAASPSPAPVTWRGTPCERTPQSTRGPRDQVFYMQGVQRHLLLPQLPEEARPANTHPSQHAALGTKSFTCRACSVTFSCPSYLKRHALRTHTPVNTRPSGPSLLHAGRAASPSPAPVTWRGTPCEHTPQSTRGPRDQVFYMQGVQRHLLLPQLPEEARPANTHPSQHAALGTKSFTCRACSVTFSCPSYLKRHALRTHTPVNTRPSGPSLLHAGRAASPSPAPVTWRGTPCEHTPQSTRGPRDQVFYMQGVQRHLLLPQLPEEARPANTHPSQHAALGTKSFTCRACSVTFSCPSYLKRHALRTHTPVNTRPYQCSACSTTFRSSYELKRHEKEHTREIKPFQCGECGAVFTQSSSLQSHVKRRHSASNPCPFSCSQCSAAFLSSSDLTRHARIHTREKPFQCGQSHHSRWLGETRVDKSSLRDADSGHKMRLSRSEFALV